MPDSVGKVIILRDSNEVGGNGWPEFTLLAVGIWCAGCGDLALRKAASGRLLALHHHLRQCAGGRGVYSRRDDPRPGTAARGLSGIRQALADSSRRTSDSGQSVGGEYGGTGRAVL